MPYLHQLAAVARRTGYRVVEVDGWQSRGHGGQPAVMGIVCHHTAGRNDMHVVRDGRAGLPGPLSQFWLRHDGSIWVIAAGRCWHNAPSTSAYHTNSNSLGIEAENDGYEPWPAVQLDAYARLCAELAKEFGLPASRVKGHKEVQPGKPDPHGIDMDHFRATVARLMKGEDVTPEEIYDAVWRRDVVPVPDDYAKKDKNPTWWAETMLRDTNAKVRQLAREVERLTELVGKLAAAQPPAGEETSK